MQQSETTEIIVDPTKLKFMHEMEIEMMSDLYSRMASACQKKCIPPRYSEAELVRGELVCIDRCVAKYLDIHGRIGKKLSNMHIQEDELIKKQVKCMV